jgi:arsenite methyltransferase
MVHQHTHTSPNTHSDSHQHAQPGGLWRFLRADLHTADIMTNYRVRFSRGVQHFAIIGLLAAIAVVVLQRILPSGQSGWVVIIALVIAHIAFLAAGALFLVARVAVRLRGAVRRAVANTINWRGDESVLEVGCGSGMLTATCAKKLTSGKVTGIDIWETTSASGPYELFWKNMRAEGVQDRVEIKRADARQMPFDEASFDVAVSSWALHHIVGYDADGIGQLVNQIQRVLKPGGQVVLVDVTEIIHMAQHALEQAGMVNVRSSIVNRMADIITATKPG